MKPTPADGAYFHKPTKPDPRHPEIKDTNNNTRKRK